MKDIASKTANLYKLIWQKERDDSPPRRWHFSAMQEVIPEAIVKGSLGIELGSGCGFDTRIMAQNYPSTKIVSLELSEGIFKTKNITSEFKNAMLIQGSVLDIPVKSGVFDFAYSFGVIHHTCSPQKGLSEIARVLKKDAAAYLYLYEDHSDNLFKKNALMIISLIRVITTRVSPKVLYALCFLLSPLVYCFFLVQQGY